MTISTYKMTNTISKKICLDNSIKTCAYKIKYIFKD
jgi:hypothetical protein